MWGSPGCRGFFLVVLGALNACLLTGLEATAATADEGPFALAPELTDHAVFACRDIEAAGNAVVDSWGLSTGAARSGEGHLRSNGDITIDGTVEVYGSATSGPGGEVILNGTPLITGAVGPASDELTCSLVDLTPLAENLAGGSDNQLVPMSRKGKEPLDEEGHFRLTGNDSVTLLAGTYLFASLRISGNATVSLDGPVRILVLGDVSIDGGINNQGDHYDLRLWCAGSSLRVESQAVVRGFLYAPHAVASFSGGADVEGAVFADSAYLAGGSEITRIIDDHPPTLEIFEPADGDTVSSCEIPISGRAGDGQTAVSVAVNDRPVELEPDGSFTTTVSLWTVDPGLIRAEVTDQAGNITVVDIRVVIPSPALSLDTPAPGSLVDQAVVDLAGSAGTATTVTVNGKSAAVVDGGWQISGFDLGADGLKTLDIVGGNCGGTATAGVVLDLDTAAPVVAIESPAAGAIFAERTITVSGTVVDPHLEAVTVNGMVASLIGDRFSAEVELQEEGVNLLEAVAGDVLGHQSLPSRVSVTLDTTAPTVAIISPATNTVVDRTTITVEGDVSDSNLGSLSVNGVRAVVIGDRFVATDVPLAEGDNDLVATALDMADHHTTSQIVVVVRDTLPPELEVDTATLPELTELESVTVTGTVTDPHIDSVLVNGVAAAISDQQWVAENVALPGEGVNEIQATASDTLGHTVLAPLDPFVITRDTLAPEIAITSPVHGALLGAVRVTVSGTVTDAHLDSESVTVNSEPAMVSGDTFTVELELAEGDTELVARASDRLDHAAPSDPVLVTVDSMPPVLTLDEPVQSVVAATSVTVTGTVIEAHLDRITVSDIQAVLDGTTFSVADVPLSEGVVNEIRAEAWDTLGHHEASNVITYVVDLEPPVLTIASPADGDTVVDQFITVTGRVEDEHPAYVEVNGIEAEVDVLDGNTFVIVDLPVGVGVTEIVAVAYDEGGLSHTVAFTVTFDTQAPVVTIDLPTLGPNECLEAGRSYTVAGAYLEPNPPPAGLPALHITIVDSAGNSGSGEPVLADGGRTWSLPDVSLGAADGLATASIIATDLVGNTSQASRTWRVDAEPPTVQLMVDGGPLPGAAPGTMPPAGTQPTPFGRTIAPQVLASDSGPGPAPLPALSLDGQPYVQGTPITIEGDHLLVAAATDCAGHTTAVHAFFHVDTSAPSLVSTDPSDGAVLADPVTSFSGEADSELAAATVDGAAAHVAGTSFTLTPYQWREGINQVTVALTDPVGNVASFVRSFEVRTLEPTLEILEGGLPIADGALFTRAVTPVLRSNDSEATIAALLNGAPFTSGTPIDSTGEYDLTATVADTLGRTAAAGVGFRIDLEGGPTVTITSPGDGAVLTETVVDVSGTAAGTAPEVTVNGRFAALSDGAWSVSAVPLDPDQLNLIVATVTDQAGRSASHTVEVMVSTSGPQLVIVAPADGTTSNRGVIDLEGIVIGGGRMTADGAVTVAGTPWPVDQEGGFRALDVPLDNEGENTIVVEAVDEQGRIGRASVTVITDTIRPQVSLTANGQALGEGSVFNDAVTVTVAVSDNAGALPPPEIRLNGAVQPAAGTATDLVIDEDGGYLLTVTASDAAGNEIRIERSFILDRGGCAISELDPSSGSVVAEPAITIRGASGRAESVVVRAPVAGGGFVDFEAQLADGTFTAGDVPVDVIGDNHLLISCSGADGQGGATTLTVHRLPPGDGPAVVITAPVSGLRSAADSLGVTGTVSDPTASVTVGGAMATTSELGDGTAAFSANVQLAEGPNIIVAHAVDQVGRRGSDRIVLWRDSRAPELRIAAPDSLTRVGPTGSGEAVVDISALVNLDTEPNLVGVTVQTPSGGVVSAPVDPVTGAVLAGSVPLDPSRDADEKQTLTVVASDSLGHKSSASVDVFFDGQGPAIRLTDPPDLGRTSESSTLEIAIIGEAWAEEGAQISVNGATIPPDQLSWSLPEEDGRRRTAFEVGISRPTSDGSFGVIARISELDGSFAQVRRLLIMDGTAPEVLELVPADGAEGVDGNALAFAVFSEPIDHQSLASVDGLTLTRLTTGDAVVGEFAVAGTAVAFVPGAELAAGESYRLRAGPGITDLVGHPLVAPGEVVFTVAEMPLGSAPVLEALPSVVCSARLGVCGTAAANSAVRVLDGQLATSGISDADGAFEINIALNTNGYHLLRVFTVDADGARSPQTTAVVRVDCSAPSVIGASFDRGSGVIRAAFSEPVDVSTLSFGGADSSVALAIDDDPTGTPQAGTLVHDTDGKGFTIELDTGVDAWWRDLDVRLEIRAAVGDLNGNVLAEAFTVVFRASGEGTVADGFLSGEVFDDASGRPLPGARVGLYTSTAALPGAVADIETSLPVFEDVTDGRGRFHFVGDAEAGRYVLLVDHPGFTTVSRRLALEPATGVVPFDSRLTPLDDSLGTLTVAGADSFSNPTSGVSVTVDPNAVPASEDLAVRLTDRSSQGLPDFLPLGWTPIAAVELRLDGVAGAVPQNTMFAAGGVRLELPLPEWVKADSDLVVARFHVASGLWFSIPDASYSGDPLVATIPMVGTGTVAVIRADQDDAVRPPLPDPAEESIILGVSLPSDFPDLEAFLTLDRAVVQPTGRATARVVARSADGITPWPSGLAVQAYLEEKLILADGSRLLEAPFASDLVLYHSYLSPVELGANTHASAGTVDFKVSPSERAAEVLLDVGWESIRIFPFTEQIERGQVLGPAGGSVSSPGGVELILPDGALPEKTVVSIERLGAEEIHGLPGVDGFTIAAAVRVELGGHDLARRAILKLTSPEPSAEPKRLVLARWIEQPPDGRPDFARIVSRSTIVPAADGRPAVLVFEPEQAGSLLPLDGIVSGGLFLVLYAESPIGFATGFVRAPSGVGLELARTGAVALGTADLSRIGGRYTAAVHTAPPEQFLEAAHPTLDEAGAATIASLGEGEIVEVDIIVEPVPPQVMSWAPRPVTGDERFPVGSEVMVVFSEALDPISVFATTLRLELASALGQGTGAFITGAVSLVDNDTSVLFRPDLDLPPGRTFIAQLSGAVRDRGGTAYVGGPFSWSFTTDTVISASGQVDPSKIHLVVPVDGIAEIVIEPGAIPGPSDGLPWIVSPWINATAADPVLDSFPIVSAGDTTIVTVGHPPRYPCTMASEVWITVTPPAGGGAAERFRLGPFVTSDRRGVVVPAGEGLIYTTPDGISFEVPEGAFEEATLVAVRTLDRDSLGVADDLGTQLVDYISVDFEGEAAYSLIVRMPAPDGVADDALVLVGEAVNTAWGRRLRLLDVGAVVVDGDERFISNDPSSRPPIQGTAKAGSATDNEILLGFRTSADAAWFAEAGAELGLVTFSVGNTIGAAAEAFFNALADAWFYMPPPSDWNGGVVLPVRQGSPLEVHRRDIATGWLVTSHDYGLPVDSDGDGVISLAALLGPDPGPPRLVDASPFHIIRFSPPDPGQTTRLRLDLEVAADDGGALSMGSPSGFELSGAAGLGVYALGATASMPGLLGPALVCGGSTLDRSFETDAGELLAVVGPGALEGARIDAFTFTFSRAVEGSLEGLESIDDLVVLTDLGPIESCTAEDSRPFPVSAETAQGDRVLLVRPLGTLAAGRHYRLELKTPVLFPDDCPPGSDLPDCAAPSTFFFSTRGVDGTPVASGGHSGLDDVRTVAKIGNLLFAGSLSGRVVATDLSGGETSTIASHQHHAEADMGIAESVRSFATDGHGRLFLNAMYGGLWAVKALAVEDVQSTPPEGRFNLEAGSIRTAYGAGFDLGTTSELLAMSAMPYATPVDFEVVVRDDVQPAQELQEFCEVQGCGEEISGAPGDHGFYEIGLLASALVGRAEPVVKPSGCEWQGDTDDFQRVTIDNLSTGQAWSADVPIAASGVSPIITFRARRGDQLRVRTNLQTIGFLAMLGSGVTVVDLNRSYRTPTVGEVWGLDQCGRRLGAYEGTEVDVSRCGHATQNNGIDNTQSLAVLEATACSDEVGCLNGRGEIHLFSPLTPAGLVHSETTEAMPGGISNGWLSCVADRPEARLRDVAVARDVAWVDRGLRAPGVGEPLAISVQDRYERPERVTGDLLFVSLGDAGIGVYDVTSRNPECAASCNPDQDLGCTPVPDCEPVQIGRLHLPEHPVYRLQVEPALGILLAGGPGGRLDVWDLGNVNVAPPEDLAAEVGSPPPTPVVSLVNVPWLTDRLGVDLSGTGLIYTWTGGDAGATAVPLFRSEPVLAGVFRAQADSDTEAQDIPAREIRRIDLPVPLGIPTELSLQDEVDNVAENERRFSAAVKVRVALPGYLGDTVTARVESLLVLPGPEHVAAPDLGPARARKGAAAWPETEASVTLSRLGDVAPGLPDQDGRFGTAFNLYESDEILLLVADPRATEGYTRQGAPLSEDELPAIDSEAGQCRRCERPSFLTDEDRVVELFVGGPYLRVMLDVEADPAVAGFFDEAYPIPAAVVELAGWADDTPSPVQVSLAEPVLNPAAFSPGEGGVAVSLVSGETMYSAVDHSVSGRAMDFTFARSYRSGLLTYNPLGPSGWTANLFTHLRENKVTGEVEYHDGGGRVWRFFPLSAQRGDRGLPSGVRAGDYWAIENSYDVGDGRAAGEYVAPKGLYLTLRRAEAGGGWQLIGAHNGVMTFDAHGRLVEVADRLRQNAPEGEVRGNRMRLFYDPFGRLARVADDYNRSYFLRYNEQDPEALVYGTLEEIEDFAGRRVTYHYDDGLRVERVEHPEVVADALFGTSSTRPSVTYSYETSSFAGDTVLHGIFDDYRLAAFRLPDRSVNRVDLRYETATGRLAAVDLPEVERDWLLSWDPVTLGDPVSKVTATAPWGQASEMHLATSGPARGRIEKTVNLSVDTVVDGWLPSAANEPAATTLLDVETRFTYHEDGSGRITNVANPDGGEIVIGHRGDGARAAEAGVRSVSRVGDTSLTTTLEYGPDNLPTSSTDSSGRVTRTQPVYVDGGEVKTVRRGHEAEGVFSDLVSTATGSPERILIGTGTAKALGQDGLEEISFAYEELEDGDGEGFLQSVVKGSGPVTSFGYDERGNPSTISLEGEEITSTTRQVFDAWDRPYSVTVAAGGGEGIEQRQSSRYDLSGRLRESTRSQAGVGSVTTTRAYDERDRVTSVVRDQVVVEGLSTATTTAYDYDQVTGLMQQVTTPSGAVIVVRERDDTGRPTRIAYPAPNGQEEDVVVHMAYDVMGRLVYRTDGHDGWWRGDYDRLGRLIDESLADGTRIRRAYDEAGDLDEVVITGKDGLTRRLRYDVASFGAVTDVYEDNLVVDGVTTVRHTRTDYDKAGREIAVKRGGVGAERTEQSIVYASDDSGRVESIEDAFGNVTSYTYQGKDPWPRTVTTVEAGSHVVTSATFAYDARGRVEHLVTSDGYSERRRYDESGNLREVHNEGPYQDATRYEWDGHGHLLNVTRPATNAQATYEYDREGRVTRSILLRDNGASEITSYDYDAAGNLKTRTLPGAPAEEFFYYPDSTLQRSTTRQVNSSNAQLVLEYEYDESNRTTASRVANMDDFGDDNLPEGLAPLTSHGDTWAYDGLGRILRHHRMVPGEDAGNDAVEVDSAIDYGYMSAVDPRPLPRAETVGMWEQLWPGGGVVSRTYDIFDRLATLSAPGVSHGFGYDALDRRMDVNFGNTTFSAHYTWGGSARYFGHRSGAAAQAFTYAPSGQLEGLGSAYGTEAAYGESADLGGFIYRWTSSSGVKEGRLVDDEQSVLAEMGWGWTVDQLKRLTEANSAGRSWSYDLGKADEMQQIRDADGSLHSVEAGLNGRTVSIIHQDEHGGTVEPFAYDSIGRRVSDGRYSFTWTWRGELDTVIATEEGDKLTYAYDADGRLLSRTHHNAGGDFLRKRVFIWNGWELLAQVGLNHADETLWRVDHLPGPVGLDDSPQLRVTTHLHPTDPVSETVRVFDLIRDEMGSVVAILEDEEAPEGDGSAPPLMARILYDPYGQAHVEAGPELRSIEHKPELTTVGGMEQVALDDGPIENPVVGIAGSIEISTSIGLSEASLAGALVLEIWEAGSGTYVAMGEDHVAIATDGVATHVMPIEGWREGGRYRLRLTTEIADEYGRPFVPPGGGAEIVVGIAIPADVTDSTDELPNLPLGFDVVFDSRAASAAVLDCRAQSVDVVEPCFPGGVNLLFQGLLTDPTTGIAYARHRWYDGRTASWLSEDPLGAVDSPNLYAFVGWGPHVGADPMGLAGYFFDGTWNDSAVMVNPTNVAKLFQAAEHERPGMNVYIKGVGTAGNVFDSTLGGLTGLGVDSRVRQAYQELVRRYNEGDRAIDIFGFSRGAAEARQFANLINEVGIPDLSSARTKRITVEGRGSMEIKVYDRYFESPEIRFMGLFDTVASVGLPGNDINVGVDLSIPENVRNVRHAVAAHERRSTFPLSSVIDPSSPNDPRILEVVFPGVHSDVGGGYSDSDALAGFPLSWMASEARTTGVPIGNLTARMRPVEDIIMHDSLQGASYILDRMTDRMLGLFGGRLERNIYYYSNSPVSANSNPGPVTPYTPMPPLATSH